MRFLDNVLFMILGIAIGGLLYHIYFSQLQKANPMPEDRQSFNLERIKQVAKLVTVEGEYYNVHPYKKYGWRELPFLTKELVAIVRAKVSVGYDLRKANFELDSTKRILRIRNLPQPEIIAIDDDWDYASLHQGFLTSFTAEELTDVRRNARNMLEKNVREGELMAKARQEGLQQLDLIRLLVEAGGWKVEITDAEASPLDLLPDSIRNIKPLSPPKREGFGG